MLACIRGLKATLNKTIQDRAHVGRWKQQTTYQNIKRKKRRPAKPNHPEPEREVNMLTILREVEENLRNDQEREQIVMLLP